MSSLLLPSVIDWLQGFCLRPSDAASRQPPPDSVREQPAGKKQADGGGEGVEVEFLVVFILLHFACGGFELVDAFVDALQGIGVGGAGLGSPMNSNVNPWGEPTTNALPCMLTRCQVFPFIAGSTMVCNAGATPFRERATARTSLTVNMLLIEVSPCCST